MKTRMMRYICSAVIVASGLGLAYCGTLLWILAGVSK